MVKKLKHPQNREERLLNAQKKEIARLRKGERNSAIRTKLAREELKYTETEDELRQVLKDVSPIG